MKQIKIGLGTWKVIEDASEHMNERRGATYKELREIRINPSLSPDLKEITLFHEILHACADFVGMEDEKLTEEEWVRRITPILLTTLKQNPDLL